MVGVGCACAVRAFMFQHVYEQTHHLGLYLYERSFQLTRLLCYLCSDRSLRNNGRSKGRSVNITHCLRAEPRMDTSTSVDKQQSLSVSAERRRPWTRLVEVYIIGSTSLFEDNKQSWEKLCPLCHSAPGWQGHTDTQRASNTLALSSPVSSVLQRQYYCCGSTLSRQRCLFCGLWHRWVVCHTAVTCQLWCHSAVSTHYHW